MKKGNIHSIYAQGNTGSMSGKFPTQNSFGRITANIRESVWEVLLKGICIGSIIAFIFWSTVWKKERLQAREEGYREGLNSIQEDNE